jgi:hypothetical protein
MLRLTFPNIQSDEDSLNIGQVSDYFSHGLPVIQVSDFSKTRTAGEFSE